MAKWDIGQSGRKEAAKRRMNGGTTHKKCRAGKWPWEKEKELKEKAV
jgi:hypothetical protein